MSPLRTERRSSLSYLSNRNQHVFHSKNCSTSENLHYGVPQVSILGPLLFLVYFNDLPNIPQHSECILYADGTKFFGLLNEDKELKTDLELISEWMESKKHTTNKIKTQIMITDGIKNIASFPWNQNTTELKRAVKYRGLILDRNITFNPTNIWNQ